MISTKKPPIGVDDFARLVDKERNYLFVDKTLFIREIIEEPSVVTLIMRPRRWGKTLNLSMLEYFFSSTVLDVSTKGLFDELAIGKAQGNYLRHQGQSPVIFFSLKDVKERNMDLAIEKMVSLLQALFRKYQGIITHSDRLTDNDKHLFEKHLNGKLNRAEIENSLLVLSELLYRHYRKSVYIFIDEYDTPLNTAYLYNYVEDMTFLMKNFFSAALKGNPYLEKSVMTGILRISKNSMLSSLNNLKVFSVLNEKYQTYFGFSDKDVSRLFSEMNLEREIQAIRDYYNGYRIGDVLLYNPWSVMECLSAGGELKPYWINTASDDILRNLLLQSSPEIKAQLQRFIGDKAHVLEVEISDAVRFESLEQDETALWSLLLATGYLTQVSKKMLDEYYECQLKIPNKEVAKLYIGVFRHWLLQRTDKASFDAFIDDLVFGRIDEFIQKLAHYLLKYTSYHDLHQESNYHTFITGLLCSLTDSYFLYSNPEAGLGRADLVLVPKNPTQQDAIIMEFKHDKRINPSEKLAREAIHQIDDKCYHEFVTGYHSVRRILKLGLAFNGKQVASAYRWDDVNGNPLGKIIYQKPLKAEKI